ncbi:MAG: hypothetical protein RLZZ58_1497, partial [Pseudomonadota bacterium]
MIPLRRPVWLSFGAGGVLATAALFLFVRFPDDTATGVQIFVFAALSGLIAYGLWSFAGLVSVLRDLTGRVRSRGRRAERVAAGPTHHHKGQLPELAPSRKTVVRRIVAALSAHGVFAPAQPDPALLYAGIADMDGSVTTETVIAAMCEVDYYHPGTDATLFLNNLVLLDTKTEQEPDYLRQLIVDLARIAGAGFSVADVVVDAEWPREGRIVPVRIDLHVNGKPLVIAYAGDIKYHSTHIAVAMARGLDAAQTGRRLAAMWTDQGF